MIDYKLKQYKLLKEKYENNNITREEYLTLLKLAFRDNYWKIN